MGYYYYKKEGISEHIRAPINIRKMDPGLTLNKMPPNIIIFEKLSKEKKKIILIN